MYVYPLRAKKRGTTKRHWKRSIKFCCETFYLNMLLITSLVNPIRYNIYYTTAVYYSNIIMFITKYMYNRASRISLYYAHTAQCTWLSLIHVAKCIVSCNVIDAMCRVHTRGWYGVVKMVFCFKLVQGRQSKKKKKKKITK